MLRSTHLRVGFACAARCASYTAISESMFLVCRLETHNRMVDLETIRADNVLQTKRKWAAHCSRTSALSMSSARTMPDYASHRSIDAVQFRPEGTKKASASFAPHASLRRQPLSYRVRSQASGPSEFARLISSARLVGEFAVRRSDAPPHCPRPVLSW